MTQNEILDRLQRLDKFAMASLVMFMEAHGVIPPRTAYFYDFYHQRLIDVNGCPADGLREAIPVEIHRRKETGEFA